FKLDLAFESYEDNNNINIPLLNETTLELNEFRRKKMNMDIEEQYNKTEELLIKYDKVLDIVGRDNFIFYDDGDVNYIWKGSKNNG
ncbi:MAG: hypothetical protein RSA10_03760, partial [Bacilli bacterium]